ncbi:MAG: hypothetical protein SGPRY_006348 [Prymnesium sp.]
MHAFAAHGDLIRFSCPLEVIEHHAPVRLATYKARKMHHLGKLEREHELLQSRSRFISLVLLGEISVNHTSRATLTEQLTRALYTRVVLWRASRNTTWRYNAPCVTPRDTTKYHSCVEHAKVPCCYAPPTQGYTSRLILSVQSDAYDYLLEMPIYSLTSEKVAKLSAQAISFTL